MGGYLPGPKLTYADVGMAVVMMRDSWDEMRRVGIVYYYYRLINLVFMCIPVRYP